MPRHPPCALNNLPQIQFLMTKSLKMLASTMQFSTFGRAATRYHRLPVKRVVRCEWSRPGLSTWPERTSPFPQDPTACLEVGASSHRFPRRQADSTFDPMEHFAPHVNVPPLSLTPPGHMPGAGSGTTEVMQMLLRKEVIQPHLPVRLPCYDFVPIASPTFDSSLPYGLGHRLRVLPTFVT